jgi:hypothetical protein
MNYLNNSVDNSGKNCIMNLWYKFWLWWMSDQHATCDCIDIINFRVVIKGQVVSIDMSDITVDGVETMGCDSCGCTFLLSKHGVIKNGHR